MKIDVSTIAGYENMTPEQKVAAFEALEIEQTADDNGSLKKLLSERNSQINKLKDQIKEKMSEAEKAEIERQEHQRAIEDENKTLRRALSVSDYTTKFIAKGFSESLAKSSAEAMVDGKMDTIMDNLGKFIIEHDKAAETERMKGMGKPASGNSGQGEITKDQFDKMGYTERVKLFNENPELYKKYTQ